MWMLWLLPLLVVRLLLPTGVMPARGEHGMALVLCSYQHLRSAPQRDHSHTDAPCPFAAAATSAPPAALRLPAPAATLVIVAPPGAAAQWTVQSGALRSQSARGPPSFS